MKNKDTLLKMAIDAASEVVAAKATINPSNISEATLPDYTEAIYKKLIELNNLAD